MRMLPLFVGRGHTPCEVSAFVDDEDFARLSAWTWSPMVQGGIVYAIRQEGTSRPKSHPKGASRSRIVLMHREVLNAQVGEIVDHANGIGIDNRKENLRFTDRQGNAANAKKKAGTSRYKGVFWDRARNGWLDPHAGGLWTAQITVGYKRILLGRFRDEVEAARAYDAAARLYFGEFSRTNFGIEE